ncbi:MAG: metalloregulator ArsR/SmtB family transcription factor [Holophagales bacterium]|nr:metalloregulator ArsR/SmtB family transcription factor [Holophagales bacterium]
MQNQPDPTHDPAFSALGVKLRPELFKALGDATRLEVLGRLICAPGPQTVSEVADCCGVHLSGVSRHLAILRDAGIVHSHKRGREVIYEPDSAGLAGTLRDLADAIDACRASCCATASSCGTSSSG